MDNRTFEKSHLGDADIQPKKISDLETHLCGDLSNVETSFTCQSMADDKIFNLENSEATIDGADPINGLATLIGSVPDTFNVDGLSYCGLRADYATKNPQMLGYLKPTDYLENNSLDAFSVEPNCQSDFQSRHSVFGSFEMDARISTYDSYEMAAASIAGRQKEVSEISSSVDFCESGSHNSISEITSNGWTPFANSEIGTITETNRLLDDDTFVKTIIDGSNDHEISISDSIPCPGILKDESLGISLDLTSKGCISEDSSVLNTDEDRIFNSKYYIDSSYEGELGYIKQKSRHCETSDSIGYLEENTDGPHLVGGFDDVIYSKGLISNTGIRACPELEIENKARSITENHLKNDGYLAKTNAMEDHSLTTTSVLTNEESIFDYSDGVENHFFSIDELPIVAKWNNCLLEIDEGITEKGVWSREEGSYSENRVDIYPDFTDPVATNSYNAHLILENEDLLDKIAAKIINQIQLSEEQTNLFSKLEKIDSDLAKVYGGALKNYELKVDNYVMTVAHSLRELINITLRTLAPDGKVKTWLNNRENKLKGVTDGDGNPHRKARIYYIFRNQSKKSRRLIHKEIPSLNELYSHLCKYSHTLPDSESKLMLKNYLEKVESHLRTLLKFLRV